MKFINAVAAMLCCAVLIGNTGNFLPVTDSNTHTDTDTIGSLVLPWEGDDNTYAPLDDNYPFDNDNE